MKVVWVKRERAKQRGDRAINTVITQGEYSDLGILPGIDDAVSLSAHKPEQLYTVTDRVFALNPQGFPLMCTIFLRERRS